MQNINEHDKKVACDERLEEITYADLPLACPPIGTRIWDAHPRVYLPIDTLGEVRCPYCGTLYILKDFDPMRRPI
jgi:uncharacterized Zn-finger protein